MQNGQNGQNWQIGEVEIQRVVEFEAPVLDPFAIYPDADAETLARHKSWLEPRLLQQLAQRHPQRAPAQAAADRSDAATAAG